jgi:hypothetical protein
VPGLELAPEGWFVWAERGDIQSRNGNASVKPIAETAFGFIVVALWQAGKGSLPPEVFVPALAAWPAGQPRPAPPAMLSLVPRPDGVRGAPIASFLALQVDDNNAPVHAGVWATPSYWLGGTLSNCS